MKKNIRDCPVCHGRYTLTEKMAKILRGRGYTLTCKICCCPILVGDEVESKQQRRGKTKFYHARCYDGSHINVPNGEDDE